MAPTKRATHSKFSPLKPATVPSGVLWILASYVIVDLAIHLLSSSHGQGHIQVIKEIQDSIAGKSFDAELSETDCSTIEDHMEVFEDSTPMHHDPWNQLKWGLPPAQCPVNGHLIERLDPLNNYRRGVALRLTNDLDDKTQIEQWFLGTKVDLNRRSKRRVFIDLGANMFTTSLLWFLQRYPCDFTEMYAFEADTSLLKLPAGWNEDQNWVDKTKHNGWQKIKSRAGFAPSWAIERIKTFNKFAGDEDDANSINITRFIKNELKLTPDDVLIVKMDIEGAEWPILRRWQNDPDMAKIIDELFVELHYFHTDNQWENMREHTREDATRMLADLRLKGIYAHYWD